MAGLELDLMVKFVPTVLALTLYERLVPLLQVMPKREPRDESSVINI